MDNCVPCLAFPQSRSILIFRWKQLHKLSRDIMSAWTHNFTNRWTCQDLQRPFLAVFPVHAQRPSGCCPARRWVQLSKKNVRSG
ncbi:hypothetical protein CY34DRAFT_763858 [Suillus luteus UH-Slu-Lm8-n1]|uniref:Uncharacterized protein n=1 Tax=Suillus luteus UH-Slu-Lm8-n1 TaxID=930992 RepID=A0A0D0A0N4_9AGAM|nr:hypothetical protein CY34DRAFT_763858 [Suillus luteus UH-Slu-Lm8-n1]